jgi:hypothetical protein
MQAVEQHESLLQGLEIDKNTTPSTPSPSQPPSSSSIDISPPQMIQALKESGKAI